MREYPPTAGLPLHWYDLLPTSRNLEDGLAQFLGVEEVQTTCSGTAALIITLTALQQDSVRDKVILPAYTCPLVALAVLHCGLTPVLCDLEPEGFDFDHQRLADLCDEQTLAIVLTHLGGRVADPAPMLKLAQQKNIFVIEDAAQSLGARWQNRAVGLAGDVGFYSLAVGKGLTTYEGGVLLTRHTALRTRLRATAERIAPSNWRWELRRSLSLLGYALAYRPTLLTLAYGMPLRQALRKARLIEAVGDDFSDNIPLHALGRWRRGTGANALRRLPAFLATLQRQAEQRGKHLAAIPGVKLMQDSRLGTGTWPFFMLLLKNRADRDQALSSLWPAGLGVSRLYIHALPDYPYLGARLSGEHTEQARDFAARMLTITNSPWLDDRSFAHICTVLERISQSG